MSTCVCRVNDYPPGLIGVVSSDRGTMAQFAACLPCLLSPPGTRLSWKFAGGGDIAHVRNQLVRELLERGAQWLLFLDDDQPVAPEVLLRLLKHQREIVAPLSVVRQPPHPANLWEPVDVPPNASDEELAAIGRGLVRWAPSADQVGGLVEVGAAGTGVLLVQRAVFRKVPGPWFEFGRLGSTVPGEDVWFSLRCRRAGVRLWADLDVQVPHLTVCGVVSAVGPDGTLRVRYAFDGMP